MPPHTYTLLSDLKIITTGVLSYLMLNRQLNKRAAASLVLLFTGICLGQYGTSTDSSSTAASSTAAAGPLGWVHGVLVMSLVAVLSAVAAVYTEWVMNFSATYKHESITVYGTTWRTPKATHGFWPPTPDGRWLVRSLRDKLSVTAWGNIPYITRYWKCKQS